MSPPRPVPGLLALALLFCVGCDALSDGGVRGRVVDATSGASLAEVGVRLVNRGSLGSSFSRTVGSTRTDDAGAFSLTDDDIDGVPNQVLFDPSGTVGYPVTTGGGRTREYRIAHFDRRVDARSNVGTVELYPTCLTAGAIKLSRPLREGEFLQFQVLSEPEIAPPYGSQSGVYPGEPLGVFGLLAVGGRSARLEWRLSRDQSDVTVGSVDLAVCPRHGVLEYEAVLDLGG